MILIPNVLKYCACRFLFLILLLICPYQLSGQNFLVSGRVVDSNTLEPLAFVNIQISGSRSGGVTDIDGFFSIAHNVPVESFNLSYVGYHNLNYKVEQQNHGLIIKMVKKPIDLAVVDVFPGENPAHRIIENTIANRQRNDPERLGSFSYESYNKFVFTGEFGEETQPPASGPRIGVTITGNPAEFLEKRHFMVMETVTQRRFRYPDLNNETVLASRISGFENPVLALIATQFQSFSFYQDHITISGREYLSPISSGSTNRYFFLLEDTTFVQNDTVFVISFRPGRGRNFEGLTGLLYINSNGWAVQNVIAEPASQLGQSRVKIQQMYELIDGRQWFPTQLNTDVEIVNFSNLNNFKLLGLGRTYIRNIELEPELKRRDFSAFAVEFSPKTIVRNDEFWNQHRPDSLTLREINTYHFLDSIGRVQNLDRRLEQIEALMSGAVRRGIFDIELKHLFGYNEQDGVQPGFGFRTNPRLSGRFSVNANIKYGLRSQKVRYGWGGDVLLDRLTNFRLGYDFSWGLSERGGSVFLENTTLLSPYNIRRLFLRDLDLRRQHLFWAEIRTLRNYLTLRGYASQQHTTTNPLYAFTPASQNTETPDNVFRFFETGLMARLAVGEQFVLTPTRTLAFGTNFPILYLNLAKGWDNALNGEHDYWRAEMKLERQFRIKMAGRQKWVLQAGYVHGQTPWPKLFTAQASYRQFAVTAPQSFATMRIAEFVSDRYVALFFYHNFENLLINRKGFSPGLVLLTNAGFGSLSQPQQHIGYSLQSMNKGYFESGFAITDLTGSGISSLGIEFMYRYGHYALPKFADNFSLRLSYSIMFR